jgi:hypothetical protein
MNRAYTIEQMFDALQGLTANLSSVVAELEPLALDDATAVELLGEFARLERLAAAGTALVAARLEGSDAWRGQGARDPVGFIATRCSTSRGRVRDGLAVTRELGHMPVLGHALRAGALTISQAADIAAAVTEHPEVEAELVELAGMVSPRQLKARCVEILAEGQGAEQQHQRATAERSAASNVGRDGIWRLSARLPVIDGAFVDKALDHFQTQVFDEARRRGDREPFDAYRADALVAMARAAMGHGGRKRPRRSSSIRHAIVITVPHSIFRPGGPSSGETCMVPGVGPVPASVVHQLLDDDPIVKAVVTRGRDITAVSTLTRTIKEDLRVAVLAANDLTCAVPGCTNTRFLQLDHEWEYHEGGPTSFDNLRPLCTFHHHQRTRENYELRGSPGAYEWVAPDGTVLSADPGFVSVGRDQCPPGGSHSSGDPPPAPASPPTDQLVGAST